MCLQKNGPFRAAKTTPGELEAANGGTVFRSSVLEGRTGERTDGCVPTLLGLCIVGGTHRRLDKLIGSGEFAITCSTASAK